MKHRLLIFLILFSAAAHTLSLASLANVQASNVAGTFYPDNPNELSEIVDGFISSASPEDIGGEIFALILPHAGYGYSGQTASLGYKLIKGKNYKTVIVIGTSHRYSFNGVSVFPQGKFMTPLGAIEVDKEFAGKLLNQDKEVFYQPLAFKDEHSVEVQLPFLQKALKNFKLVPIVTGDCTLETCKKLSALLKAAIKDRKDVLVVASSDLYHGYDYQEAKVVDSRTISCISNMDAQGLYYGLREGKFQLCGGLGVVSAIILAKELGHNKVKLLKSTNSALVTGKIKKGVWTVGYASLAIGSPALTPDSVKTDRKKGGSAMFNREQRAKLLKIARSSIEAYLKTGSKPQLSETDPALLGEMGAFVTLRKHKELRGCIGNFTGKGEPFYITIRDMAIESATADPRFPPLTRGELEDIDIEISALSPMQRIESPDNIRLGVDGVLVRKGFRSGVFLPQVATETGWSKDEFMSNLCAHKAGLAPDAWKTKDIEIYTFTAEIFSEEES